MLTNTNRFEFDTRSCTLTHVWIFSLATIIIIAIFIFIDASKLDNILIEKLNLAMYGTTIVIHALIIYRQLQYNTRNIASHSMITYNATILWLLFLPIAYTITIFLNYGIAVCSYSPKNVTPESKHSHDAECSAVFKNEGIYIAFVANIIAFIVIYIQKAKAYRGSMYDYEPI